MFIVESANFAGELARAAEPIASRGINLEVICLGLGERGGSAFLAQDEAGVPSALTDAEIGFREVPVLTIGLEDRPGEAAETARRLADAGVNIELFAPVDYGAGHKATIAIGVDRVEEARRALADQLTERLDLSSSGVGGSRRQPTVVGLVAPRVTGDFIDVGQPCQPDGSTAARPHATTKVGTS